MCSIEYSDLDSPTLVTLDSNRSGADIYYIVDGEIPSSDDYFGSTYEYVGPFEIYQPTTIKAIAVHNGNSSRVEEKYLNVTPVILSLGDTHDFNGLELTLDEIIWYKCVVLLGASDRDTRFYPIE
jgi:hypothetical protein